MTSITNNAKPMTAEELIEAIDAAGGRLDRKLIVIHVGNKTIDGSVFLHPNQDIDGAAVVEFVREKWGDGVVYFLVNVYMLAYKQVATTRLVARAK